MKKKKAFTLLELIISLALVSVLVLIISSMLSFNFKVTSQIYKKDYAGKEAANAMVYVENVVREASSIEKTDDPVCNFIVDLSGSQYTFSFKEDEKKLRADIKNSGKNPVPVWIGSVDDVIFTYNGEDEVFLRIRSLDGKNYQTRIKLGLKNEKESLH